MMHYTCFGPQRKVVDVALNQAAEPWEIHQYLDPA